MKLYLFSFLKRKNLKLKNKVFQKRKELHILTCSRTQMFFKKKSKEKREGWLYQIRDTPGIKFETSSNSDVIPPKQVVRVNNIYIYMRRIFSYLFYSN